ncbi:MAG: RAMP superfamily CRISPR-associated protein [Planctomycetota bacterium]
MKLTLRTESPVHVGNGEYLTWLDYALVGRTVHVLDWRAIMEAALLATEDAGDRLAEFSDNCADLLKKAGDLRPKAPGNQRSEILRKLREETNPIRFAKETLGNDLLARAIRSGDYDRYSCEYTGGRLDRRLEIRSQAKDGAGKPTIPASVLKGQIRTALAHAVLGALDEEGCRRILEGGGGLAGWNRDLQESTPGRARFQFGDEIEAAAFRPPSGQQRRVVSSDPRVDLMRFLRVSDPLRSSTSMVVLRASPFGPVRGRGENSTHLQPLQPTVMEAIDTGSQFEFELSVDSMTLRGAAAAGGGGHPLVRDGFWTLFARVFGLTRDEVKGMDDATMEQRMLSAVEVSLAGRMSALLSRESAWFDRMSAPRDAPLRAFVERLRKQEGGRLPLRIGWGTGLHSLTVLPALEAHPMLAGPLAQVMARTGLGMKPRERRMRAEREKLAIEQARREGGGKPGSAAVLREELLSEKTDPTRLPVSRRMTMEGGEPGEYLGFATLVRGEMTADPPRDRKSEQQMPEPAPAASGKKIRREKAARPKKERPVLPDRPASQTEIADLLKKFGPKH